MQSQPNPPRAASSRLFNVNKNAPPPTSFKGGRFRLDAGKKETTYKTLTDLRNGEVVAHFSNSRRGYFNLPLSKSGACSHGTVFGRWVTETPAHMRTNKQAIPRVASFGGDNQPRQRECTVLDLLESRKRSRFYNGSSSSLALRGVEL